MSRSYCSYNEDWQRRKAVLIRSLFHDIPILSPVAEESNDSYQYAPSQEVYASPPRPYSPLPPLIIERVPITNKHDEPEEYYRKLHNKIKKIYLKLFVENRNLNSVDYESDYNDSSVIEDNVIGGGPDENLDLNVLESVSPGKGEYLPMIQDRETSESSKYTNGYETDFESMDTEMVDIVNYTASNEEETRISEKEESSTDRKRRTIDHETNKEEEINEPTISDKEMTESEETNEIEEEQSYEQESLTKNLGKRKIVGETSKTEASKRVRIEQEDSFEEQKSNVTSNGHKLTESEESNKMEEEQSDEQEISSNDNIGKHEIILKPVTIDVQEEQSTIDDHESTSSEVSSTTDNEKQLNNVIESDLDSNEKVVKSTDKKTASEDTSRVETMEEDEGTSHSSEDADFRQITTEALVHIDGSQDAGERESRVYEDSVRSVILPTRFRKLTISRYVDIDEGIEVLPVLEESAGPKFIPTFDTEESVTSDEDIGDMGTPQPDTIEENIDEVEATERGFEERRSHQVDTAEKEMEVSTIEENATGEEIEEMRSHLPDLSQGTIPITHHSQSVSTSDRTPFPQEPTVMTSSSQDGVDRDNSEFKISYDVNEILNSIFNESGKEDKTLNSARKRKLFVDKSVQAVQGSRVSWNDIRTNFFVGTPKIFRLCACNDHICH